MIMWQSVVALLLLVALLRYRRWRREDEERWRERDLLRTMKREYSWDEMGRVDYLYPR